jgi:hypothetical protein
MFEHYEDGAGIRLRYAVGMKGTFEKWKVVPKGTLLVARDEKV